jgi:hypothetical protein
MTMNQFIVTSTTGGRLLTVAEAALNENQHAHCSQKNSSARIMGQFFVSLRKEVAPVIFLHVGGAPGGVRDVHTLGTREGTGVQ